MGDSTGRSRVLVREAWRRRKALDHALLLQVLLLNWGTEAIGTVHHRHAHRVGIHSLRNAA